MSLKTFLTRSFFITSEAAGDGRSVVFAQNHHEDATLTDITIELDLPKSLRASQEIFSIETLAPGERIELATIEHTGDDTLIGGNSLKAKCVGRVDGEDVDKETLSVALNF